MKKLKEFHKIIDEQENIEVNINDEVKTLFLLSSLPRYFENFEDKLIYGNENNITLYVV